MKAIAGAPSGAVLQIPLELPLDFGGTIASGQPRLLNERLPVGSTDEEDALLERKLPGEVFHSIEHCCLTAIIRALPERVQRLEPPVAEVCNRCAHCILYFGLQSDTKRAV